jgi:cleavage and polyadenylation specificity factor subunit 2
LSQYGLVLLEKQAYNTIEFAKSQLEWMSTAVQKSFDLDRVNPFEFKYVSVVSCRWSCCVPQVLTRHCVRALYRFVRLCHSVEELEALPKPLVVLATTASLEWGFARDLFVEWSSNPRHAVIFTDRPQPGTLGHLVLTQQPPALGLEVQASFSPLRTNNCNALFIFFNNIKQIYYYL